LITYATVGAVPRLTAYDTQKLKEIAYATEGNPQNWPNRLPLTAH